MLVRPAPSLALVALTLIAGGCAMLHRQQPLTWRLVVELDHSVPDIEKATSQTVAILERRLDTIGVRDAKVDVIDAKAGRIQIQLPAVADRERLKAFLTSGGKLEIVHVISPPHPTPVMAYDSQELAKSKAQEENKNYRVLPLDEDWHDVKRWAIVEAPSIITNTDMRNASAIPASGDAYHVSFTLRQDGAQRFSSWTQNNINQYVGVVLNDEIKSTVFIKSQLFDSAEIAGNFTKASAEDLAQILMSGPFPAPIRIVEEPKN